MKRLTCRLVLTLCLWASVPAAETRAQPKAERFVIPNGADVACDPSAGASRDLSGEWFHAGAAEGTVSIEQKGTCVALTARWQPNLVYQANGIVWGDTVTLRWRTRTAKGELLLYLIEGRLWVKRWTGGQPWPGHVLDRAPGSALLELTRRLLKSAEEASAEQPDRAHALLRAVSLLAGTGDTPATRRKVAAPLHPDVARVASQAQELQGRLPAWTQGPGPLASEGANVLVQEGQLARMRGDRETFDVCRRGAEAALPLMAAGNAAARLALAAGSLQAQIPYVVRSIGLNSKQSKERRQQALDLCASAIAAAVLGVARARCEEADSALSDLSPNALEVELSSQVGRAAQASVKGPEAIAEAAVADAHSRRFRELVALAEREGLPEETRAQALAWAERVLGELSAQLQRSTAFRDAFSASQAAHTTIDPGLFGTLPRDLTTLFEMYRQAGYGTLLSSGLAIEGLATSFASRFARASGLAFYLLSQRKGKAHAIEGAISRVARRPLAAEYRALRMQRGRLSAAYLERLEDPAAGRHERISMGTEIATIEQKIALYAQPKLARSSDRSQGSPEEAWLADVRAALPRDGALISYQRYRKAAREEPRYAAFVVGPSAPALRVLDLGPAVAIDERIEAFTASLRSLAPEAELHDVGAPLYAALFQPIRASLKTAAKLWISPDAEIARVPFAALYDGRNFLIDDYELQIVESAPDHARPRSLADSRSVVVFANPTRGEALYSHPDLDPQAYADLAGAAAEAQLLAQVFPRQLRRHQGAAADEAALFAVSAPTILHFAGHGIWLSPASHGTAAPQARGLALVAAAPSPVFTRRPTEAPEVGSPAQATLLLATSTATRTEALQNGLDGFATAYELSTLDLHGTELVVLSACESARGASGDWSGVSSVQQALHTAGARGVLATLWNVEDQATLHFMRALYTRLAGGAALPTAVRGAMIELKRAAASPSQWAPFVLSVMSRNSWVSELPVTARKRAP